MSDRRIIYVLEPFDVPFGGVAAIYRHVEILHAHGLPAFVALPRRPARDFYGSTAPLLIHEGPLQNLARPGDIFVIPEGFPAVMKALAQTPARRLMFCQNYYLLPFSGEPGAGIAEYEVNGVHRVEPGNSRLFRRRLSNCRRANPAVRDRSRTVPAGPAQEASDRLHAPQASSGSKLSHSRLLCVASASRRPRLGHDRQCQPSRIGADPGRERGVPVLVSPGILGPAAA